MSSDFLSQPIPKDRYTLIVDVRHTQKSLGSADVIVVLLRDDLMHTIRYGLHSMLY